MKPKPIKIKGEQLEQAMPKPEDDGNDFETQGHLRTLIDAHEIMNNPTKMKKVHKLAGRHATAIRGLQDVKDHYNEKYGGKNALKHLSSGEEMEGTGDGDESGE